MDIPTNMRTYVAALLYRGERYLERGTPAQQAVMQRHLAYTRTLAERGVYRAMGPLTDEGEVLAIAILDLPTIAAAEAALAADPAMQARHFRAETHPLFFPSLDGVHIDYPP